MDAVQGTARARTPSQRLEPEVRERLPDGLLRAIDFHGHLCPGLVVGYRAAVLVMDRLGVAPGTDEELLGIVETDACGADAFQVLTGCTLGKGNLVFKDYGKDAYTLVKRSDGRAARFVLNPGAYGRDPEHMALFERVRSGQARDVERAEFWRRHVEMSLRFLERPAREFGRVADVEVEAPQKAWLFDSVVCSVCGESVMEPRSRMRAGKPCCIPCATKYGRGWEINE